MSYTIDRTFTGESFETIVERTRAARTGDAPAVDDEDLIRDRRDFGKFAHQVLIVEPAHAAAVPAHDAGTDQRQRCRAQTDDGDILARGLAQEGQGLLVCGFALVKQSADNDHIVET